MSVCTQPNPVKRVYFFEGILLESTNQRNIHMNAYCLLIFYTENDGIKLYIRKVRLYYN